MSPRGRRKAIGTSGAKALVTVLAMLGTVVGWAELTRREGAEGAPEPTPTAEPLVLSLRPVPTLVPEPTAIGAPVVVQPTPTQVTLRVVNEPVESPSLSSRSGGGGGAAKTRSSG